MFLSSIEFKEDFAYGDAEKTLFKKGQVISLSRHTLITGRNGSGKSTLLNIIHDKLTIHEKGDKAAGTQYSDLAIGTKKDLDGVVLHWENEEHYQGHIKYDTYKDSVANKSYFDGDIRTQILAMRSSRGEGLSVQLGNAMKNAGGKVILLDEPADGLDTMAKIALSQLLKRTAIIGNNQIIVASHDSVLLDNVNLFLDLNDNGWKNFATYYAEQETALGQLRQNINS